MFVKNEKEKIPKSKYNMWQNTGYMIWLAWKLKEKKVLVTSLLLACLAVMNNIINLYISPMILSVVERKAPISELIITIVFFVGSMMLMSVASAYVNENKIFGRIGIRTGIVGLINKKAATTSYPNMNDENFLRLCSKACEATSGNDRATEAIWNTMVSLIENILGFTIYMLLLTTVQPFLLLVILITAILSYFISNSLGNYGYANREEEAEYVQKIMYIVNQAKDWSAAKDIRIFGMRSWLEELGDKAMEAYIAFHKKAQGVYLWAKIVDIVLTFLRNGIAYAYLVSLVVAQEIAISQFLLLFSAVGGFAGWISGILGTLYTLHKQSLEISIVRECLEYPEPFLFEDGQSLAVEDNKSYEIRLEHVTFRYPKAEKDTLTDINLTLHSGEKLAVVGLNGAGKTTLVKLICGFLDPTKGRVLLNGVDIRTYNRVDYYKMFSAVFQNFSLLAGTVAANVAQTEDEIDMERVRECVEKAGLGKKIESMPKGYETYLNRTVYEEAMMLSGGETQCLMLARALYKDSPFVILDEPTAALDPIAESEMYQKYNEMTKGKSSVYISHRLASTRFCDRIIFIESAVILEEGTHEELIQKEGRYAELFAVQSKYYKEGEDINE